MGPLFGLNHLINDEEFVTSKSLWGIYNKHDLY